MSIRSEMLRSDFLIHWTGKDIQKRYKYEPKARQAKYIGRLRSTLVGEYPGLWMNKTDEIIDGGNGASIKYGELIPITCFSEIKLSDVGKHTERYGKLGFGFSRDFMLARYGAPVQYVSGTEVDIIVQNYADCWKYMERIDKFINSRDSNPLDADHVHDLHAWVKSARITLDANISFVKNMSDPDHANFPNDFTFLNEVEWRIVKTKKACNQELIKNLTNLKPQPDGSLENVKARRESSGEKYPEALIPFERSDLRILIFPDAETRKQAFADLDIQQWFGDPPDFPAVVTVQECLHF